MPKFSPIASYLIYKNLTLSPPYGPTIHKNTKRPSPWSVDELQSCVSSRTIERVFVLIIEVYEPRQGWNHRGILRLPRCLRLCQIQVYLVVYLLSRMLIVVILQLCR